MASPQESVSMALFCDFENVALGVRDANYEKFDIKPVLERLLLKGSIVVKKAYCDWDRYKGFKSTMHEASFELIEIPHKRQSGKNSADIRLVVDALDLCYTKLHVDTFVIISGDSDFSPLVSKLRENAKKVIGVGVKNSTSDLLVANCDEFIFYDDLVRDEQRAIAKREAREAREAAVAAAAATAHAAAQSSAAATSSNASGKRPADEEKSQSKHEIEARKSKAFAIAVETFDALVAERGDQGKIWASVLKNAIKRRKPDFSESYYGFRAFGSLLDEAQARGLLEVGRDEKSGAFVFRSNQLSGNEAIAAPVATAPVPSPALTSAAPQYAEKSATPADEERDAGDQNGARAVTHPAQVPHATQEQDAAPRESSRSRSRRASRQKMRERAIDAARQSPPISEKSSEPGVGFDSVHTTLEAAHVAEDLEAAVSGPLDVASSEVGTVPTPYAPTSDSAAALADAPTPQAKSTRSGARAARQGRRTPPSQAFGAPYQAPKSVIPPLVTGRASGTNKGNQSAQAPLFDTHADAHAATSADAPDVPSSAHADAAPTPSPKPSPARRARTAAAKKAALAEADALASQSSNTHASFGGETTADQASDVAHADGSAKPPRTARKSVASTRRARTRPIVVVEE